MRKGVALRYAGKSLQRVATLFGDGHYVTLSISPAPMFRTM